MNRSLAFLVLLVGAAAVGCSHAADLHPQDLHPQDFAYGMPIKTAAAAAAYRLTIPVEVYRNAAHADLSDLRVFNARGEVVPYELRPVTAEPSSRPREQALPLFQLRAGSRATLNGVQVTVRSLGANVDLHASPGTPTPAVITSYVLDGRVLDQPLSGLRLHWPTGAPEFAGSVRVEYSDDLSSWRVARPYAPAVNLRTGGAALVQDLVAFPATRAKFWRLTWVGQPAPFVLTSVTAELTPRQPLSPTSSVTANGSPVPKMDGELAFDLGAKLPVTTVNLALPEPNSALTIELLSRANRSGPWHPVTEREFYRVGTGVANRTNAPVDIPVNFDRFWLARQVRPTAPIAPLQLQATWDTQEVLFLARGPGPFTLAYGNAAANQGSVPLDTLLQDVTITLAGAGPSFVLGGAERLRPSHNPLWKMAVLWIALGAGVLVLGWMAYRLSRDLASGADDTSD